MKKMKHLLLAIALIFCTNCAQNKILTYKELDLYANEFHSKQKRGIASDSTESIQEDNNGLGVVDKTFNFQPHLEVPEGSVFEKVDSQEKDQWCKGRIGKNPRGKDYYQIGAQVAINGPSINWGSHSYWTGWIGAPQSGSWQKSGDVTNSSDLSGSWYSAETGILEIRIPYNNDLSLYGSIKIYMDSSQNIMRGYSIEVRKGPSNQKFENMSLQAKFSCMDNLVALRN